MANNQEELVWAKKAGHKKRQFTRRQLEAMGKDLNETSFDGWEIVDEVEDPEEVKEARKAKAAKSDDKKVKPLTKAAKSDATKTDTDNGQTAINTEENAERGAENTDLGGSTTTSSGEGNQEGK